MARIRTIKPSFFTSEDVSALPLRARLTWIGLWTHCDDAGRAKDNPKLIKAAIWPLDNVTLADIEEDLSTLAEHGRIVRYEVDGKRLLEVTNWSEHQKISRPTPSKLPPPSRIAHAQLSEGSHQEGKGRERKGSVARDIPEDFGDPGPDPRCPKHLSTRNPPNCGNCADARKARNRWETERSKRWASLPRCPLHRNEIDGYCGPCRSEELVPA